jgi:uncharacterized protein (TIGR03437 family)
MFSRVAFLSAFLAVSIFAGKVQLLPALPNGANSVAMQLDAAGNIYLAGSYTPDSKVRLSETSGFVAKLSPDGSKVLYFTPLAGNTVDAATVLAIGSDGSAYIGGNTNSSDFPVTPGAMLTSYAGGGAPYGFLVKVNPAGSIVYATYIGVQQTRMQITGIALDSAGEVFLTGLGGPGNPPANARVFVLKLDTGLTKILLSNYGYGGGLIALDSQGNIYLAGSALPNLPFLSGAAVPDALPPFAAGAFQPMHDATFCFFLNQGPGGGGGAVPCSYQYVAKLDATGKLIWGTYVTGTYGAIAGGMAVDSTGNVIVAGTTNSDDYPVTAGAFQTAYAAGAPPFPVAPGNSFSSPPPGTGYVTKVNATGTGLIWSTYFGGSYSDSITAMAVSSTGEIFISGIADSNDLPALAGTPDGCRPQPNQVLGFVTRLAADATTAGPSQLVTDAPHCTYFACGALAYNTVPNYQTGWPVVLRPDGTALLAGTNGAVASVDFSSSSRLTCVIDPADNVQLRTVTPGQVLSIFGTDLAPSKPSTPPTGVGASSDNFGVSFNGIPAPILYSSAQQINVQVPFEISGQTSVQMKVVDQQDRLPLSETLTLGVAERQPAIFLSPTVFTDLIPSYTVTCVAQATIGLRAEALNADGSLNDCNNPAIAGTTVTLYVDGLGQVTPALTTGAIAPSPAVAITPGVDLLVPGSSSPTVTTLSVPGSISGVAQVQLQLPTGLAAGAYQFVPSVAGMVMRERLVIVWVRPNFRLGGPVLN